MPKSITNQKSLIMKKIALVFVAVLISSMGYAQVFMIGPRVGISSSQVKIEDIPDYSFKKEGPNLAFMWGCLRGLPFRALASTCSRRRCSPKVGERSP